MPRVQILLPLPSIKEPTNAYDSAFAGFFHAKILRLDTLYRDRISVAKSSKRPNIREYSNCCRLVHHQKSISQFREKNGSVPRVEDRDRRRKEMHLFCSTLVGRLGSLICRWTYSSKRMPTVTRSESLPNFCFLQVTGKLKIIL